MLAERHLKLSSGMALLMSAYLISIEEAPWATPAQKINTPNSIDETTSKPVDWWELRSSVSENKEALDMSPNVSGTINSSAVIPPENKKDDMGNIIPSSCTGQDMLHQSNNNKNAYEGRGTPMISVDQALKYGEYFRNYLENCGKPTVTLSNVAQVRGIIDRIRDKMSKT